MGKGKLYFVFVWLISIIGISMMMLFNSMVIIVWY